LKQIFLPETVAIPGWCRGFYRAPEERFAFRWSGAQIIQQNHSKSPISRHYRQRSRQLHLA